MLIQRTRLFTLTALVCFLSSCASDKAPLLPTTVDGVATFECFASRSGGCHYRIYEERCEGAAGAANEAGACTRKTLDAFALTVGKRRQVEGLPTAFRLCVGEDDASGCG